MARNDSTTNILLANLPILRYSFLITYKLIGLLAYRLIRKVVITLDRGKEKRQREN